MSWWVWALVAIAQLVVLGGALFSYDSFGVSNFGLMCRVLLILEAMVGLGAAIGIPVDRNECRQVGRNYGTEVRWEFPSGCYVKVGDHFVPKDKFITNREVK